MSDFAPPGSQLGSPNVGTLQVAAYPTAGQGLALDSRGSIPPTLLGVIADTTLRAAGTIDFQNIPQMFSHLKLVLNGRDTATGNSTGVFMRINNDSTTNIYTYAYMHNNSGTTVVAVDNTSAAQGLIGAVVGASAGAALAGQVEVDIYDYRGTTFDKRWVSQWGLTFGQAAGQWETGQVSGLYISAVAINRITLTNSFAAGTRATLYGRG